MLGYKTVHMAFRIDNFRTAMRCVSIVLYVKYNRNGHTKIFYYSRNASTRFVSLRHKYDFLGHIWVTLICLLYYVIVFDNCRQRRERQPLYK